ncbi:MAG: hypothetical protein ABGX27_07485 [Desulfurobacteriaceae bacterium]
MFIFSVYVLVLSRGILVALCSKIFENKGYNGNLAIILVFLDFIGLLVALLVKERERRKEN